VDAVVHPTGTTYCRVSSSGCSIPASSSGLRTREHRLPPSSCTVSTQASFGRCATTMIHAASQGVAEEGTKCSYAVATVSSNSDCWLGSFFVVLLHSRSAARVSVCRCGPVLASGDVQRMHGRATYSAKGLSAVLTSKTDSSSTATSFAANGQQVTPVEVLQLKG
jgi:hypothetical protein